MTQAVQKEKMRRTNGKDLGQLKLEMQRKEALKVMQDRKKEKAADKRAKLKAQEDIAKDRAERAAARLARENEKKGIKAAVAVAVASKPSIAEPKAAAAKKEYTTARIQVRSAGARPVTNTFQATDTVKAIFDHVRASLPACPPRFSLGMARPKRDYTEADYGLSLKDAGLLPSAALNLKVLPSVP